MVISEHASARVPVSLLPMSYANPWSLNDHGNDKSRGNRRTADHRVVTSGSSDHRSPESRRPAVTEPRDVLADDAQCRRKPTRDERGRDLARRIAVVPNRSTHP